MKKGLIKSLEPYADHHGDKRLQVEIGRAHV